MKPRCILTGRAHAMTVIRKGFVGKMKEHLRNLYYAIKQEF
jgi:hypothetical protein